MTVTNIYTSYKELPDTIRGSLAGMQSLVSDKFGIINAIAERDDLKKFNLAMVQTLSTRVSKLFNLKSEPSTGGMGIDYNPGHAALASVAEAVERYCMSYIPRKDIQVMKYSEFPESQRVENYHLYSKKQYADTKDFVDPKLATIEWVDVGCVDGSETPTIKWPASLIYIPYEGGYRVAETSSTGMAAHTDRDAAIQSGLLEVIERDALMIYFLNRLRANLVDVETIQLESGAELLRSVIQSFNIVIYRLVTDLKIPTYLVYIWNNNGPNGFHFGIGACAALDSDNAIHKALKECLFTYHYSRGFLDARPLSREVIQTLYEHYLYYQDESRFRELLFETAATPYTRERFTRKELFADILKNGYHVYSKDLTTSDIKPCGLHVVKVVVPGFVDLNKSYCLRREAAERLKTIPILLGQKPLSRLSSLPHPMP